MREIDTILGWTFMLILVFLIFSRADEVSTIIQSFGNFWLAQIRVLQGVTTGNAKVIQPTSQLLRNAGYSGGWSPQPVPASTGYPPGLI